MTVAFTPPALGAGAPPITGYTVVAVPTNPALPNVTLPFSDPALPLQLGGLVEGEGYQLVVVASSAAGTSPPSALAASPSFTFQGGHGEKCRSRCTLALYLYMMESTPCPGAGACQRCKACSAVTDPGACPHNPFPFAPLQGCWEPCGSRCRSTWRAARCVAQAEPV